MEGQWIFHNIIALVATISGRGERHPYATLLPKNVEKFQIGYGVNYQHLFTQHRGRQLTLHSGAGIEQLHIKSSQDSLRIIGSVSPALRIRRRDTLHSISSTSGVPVLELTYLGPCIIVRHQLAWLRLRPAVF